jgi:hypothetical protein
MHDPYSQFGKHSKRSEVTRGGNRRKRSFDILKPPLPRIPPSNLQFSRSYERWFCPFETDTEEGLLNHLHKGHGRYN